MLPDLAEVADLSARGWSGDVDVAAVMLAVASSLVREAAGSPISETDSTVALWALEPTEWLPLPGQPITEVTSVTGTDSTISDWMLVEGKLWRRCGWYSGWEPTEVTVVMTHGFPTVPAYIVQLVCDLALLGIATATAGALDPRVIVEQIDDYKVTFADGAEAVSSAMTLPLATRLGLAAQFGGGAGMVRWL